ncbi:hypothetical protein I5Q34_14085 [Streptomyces sp. AV19]|uniref:hypothetical protein n=1 Tax=Streptomyces sp. AV19 TaxID=2793068 RepID=UPI0018FED330|nr:hypothetical protein [Streptomyces sp. AV19]MBH1935389.1 hypothetical protein [Streptomyces sp. AV19]MDG4531275.1 hypothetical protein [Streptomyces sp. AV19]
MMREPGHRARPFDIRLVLGGLFTVYGVLVTAAGIAASDEDLAKAQGVNINLWTGLGLLALGGVFLLWLRWRPGGPPRSGERPED